jgi:hypothetical protein
MKKIKIAICFNEKYDWFEAYRYTWYFRLFGAEKCWRVGWGRSEEDLIAQVRKQLFGKLTFIRVVELTEGGRK